jgi:hypothetical protein
MRRQINCCSCGSLQCHHISSVAGLRGFWDTFFLLRLVLGPADLSYGLDAMMTARCFALHQRHQSPVTSHTLRCRIIGFDDQISPL